MTEQSFSVGNSGQMGANSVIFQGPSPDKPWSAMPTAATIYCGCGEGPYHCPDAYAILVPADRHGECPGCHQWYEVLLTPDGPAVRCYRPEEWAFSNPHAFRVEWVYG